VCFRNWRAGSPSYSPLIHLTWRHFTFWSHLSTMAILLSTSFYDGAIIQKVLKRRWRRMAR
jgi:hypothetical protein